MFGLQKNETCPTCCSRFRSIHGMIFNTDAQSHQCDDVWHRGESYDPNILQLTCEDRDFLADLKVLAE